MGQANINGNSFSFVDAKVTIFGIELFSVSQITATGSQDKVNNYGNQPEPQSRGRGKIEYEASFDCSYKEMRKLKKLAPGGKLTKLPPTSCVIFLDNGTDKQEIVLPTFEFKDDGLEFGDGDPEARRSYPAIMSDIIETQII